MLTNNRISILFSVVCYIIVIIITITMITMGKYFTYGELLERHCLKGPESLSRTSGRNGPLTDRDLKVPANPDTPHRETAAKGERHNSVS